MKLDRSANYIVTNSGLRKVSIVDGKSVEVNRDFFIVQSGTVKVSYGKGCMIFIPGDVFAADDATDIKPVRWLIGGYEPVSLKVVEPTVEQMKVLVDKCADKLEMLTADVALKVKVEVAEKDLIAMGVRPTRTMVGEYLNRCREVIGRAKKDVNNG